MVFVKNAKIKKNNRMEEIVGGTEIIFSQNLFRCPTPARMTRFEKLDSSAFSNQSATDKMIKEAETFYFVPASFY